MNIQIVGAGSWGLALARLAANNGHRVRLWCRDEDGPDLLREERRSPHYLPDLRLPESVEVARDIDPRADIAVLAVPSHAMRTVAASMDFSPTTIRVSVAKGIENESLARMSEVVHQECGDVFVVALSGPTHAEEVAQDLPASIVAASPDPHARDLVQQALMCPSFRVYTSPDIVGVELGGSLKNVIAIAAGCCEGLGLGSNASAALVTRGLAEMVRLGRELGADPLTFAGLSGMGDLIVTCLSSHSRNRRLGERLAAGEKLDDIVSGTKMVAEGVRTAKSAKALGEKLGVDMPIAEQVYGILFDDLPASEAVDSLMRRDPKPEKA